MGPVVAARSLTGWKYGGHRMGWVATFPLVVERNAGHCRHTQQQQQHKHNTHPAIIMYAATSFSLFLLVGGLCQTVGDTQTMALREGPSLNDERALKSSWSKRTRTKKGGKKESAKKGSKGKGSSDSDEDEPPVATEPPVVTTPQFVQVAGCFTDGDCIYSGPTQGFYLANELCEWTVAEDAILQVEYFDLELTFDTLAIDGTFFSGTGDGVDGLVVFSGQSLIFQADFEQSADGFKICFASPAI
jgi:hypothetical protein